MKQSLKLAALCVVTCFVTNQAQAGAFANEDLSASAAGVANAVVASSDDVSAVFYNPAGLAWQEGLQIMIGSQSRYRTLAASDGSSAQHGHYNLPELNSLAISWLPTGEKWGVSGSIVSSYAGGTRWTSAFGGRLGETTIELQRYAADVFWRTNNTLALSMGLDMYDSIIRLNDANASFSGRGWSNAGAHAGLRWEFAPFWILGMHMRQGAELTIDDKFGMTLPDEITVGLAHDLVDDEVRIELDIKQSNWSSFGDMKVTNNGAANQTVAVNLKDTTDVALGATWFWRDETQLRIGYAYEEGANQLDGFQPAIADLTGHRLALGFGGMMSGMHLDVAWAGVYYPDAHATGAYAAKYSDVRYSLLFSLTKKF